MEKLLEINAGQILENYIKNNKISKAALSRALKCDDSNILYYQKRKSLQTKTILELSNILKHNFFMDIAAQLPQEYSTTAIADTTKDVKIKELENEIALLKAREEVLLLAIRK